MITKFNVDLASCDHKSVCLTGDLANMYTSLDHSSIRTAIRWVLFDTQKKRFRDRRAVSIPVSKNDNDIHFGRSLASDGSRLTLSYDDLLSIVEFDLDNSFFKIGDFIGKQTSGIPMGSPLSPALAVIVCAYYENKIYSMIDEFGWDNTILGTRYMDDVLSFISHDGSVLSKLRARWIGNFIKYGYHDKMDLECEDTSVPFKFLSTVIDASPGNPVSFSFYSKNAESIRLSGNQKFLTFQHYGSISPPSQKLSVVVSALHRICMSSSSLAAFTSAFTDLKSELRSLLYPDSIITKALNRVMSHSRFTALS